VIFMSANEGFALSDFQECCKRVKFPAEVKRVIDGWGVSGRDYADWTGGFTIEFTNGQYGYLSGWSDSSGWG